MLDVALPPTYIEITRRVVSTSTQPGTGSLPILIALLAVAIAVSRTAGVVRSNFTQMLGVKTGARARYLLVKKVAALDVSQLDDPGVRDRLERAGSGIVSRPNRVVTSSMSLLTSATLLGVLLAILASIRPLVALFALLSVIPLSVSQRYAARLNYQTMHDVAGDSRRANYMQRLVTDRSSGVELVVSGAVNGVVERFRTVSESIVHHEASAIRMGARAHLRAGIVSSAVLAFGFLVAVVK